MVYDGIAKVQHYVPQFLLRNFGDPKKHRLCVFDKQNERIFVSNVRNVACESRFYDFDLYGETVTLEPSLSKIEDAAKPLLNRVLSDDSLSTLSAEERAHLSIFFSIQLTRTRCYYEQWLSLPILLRENLLRNGGSEESIKGFEDYLRVPDKNEATREFTRLISEAPKNYAVQFASKIWLLLKTSRSHPFMIGDNPLTLNNTMDMWPRGNIGLSVRGIEIYFPLSPKRALALWCPSHGELFRRALTTSKHDHLPIIEETISAIESGQPLMFRHDNVVYFNSLQILYAERYVFSNTDNFSLARKMIASNDNVRCGPRYQMS